MSKYGLSFDTKKCHFRLSPGGWERNMADSGVARAFPGGRVAHPEGQNEEENTQSLRENKKNWWKFEEKMRKVEHLPTRDMRLATALMADGNILQCIFSS